MGKKAAPKRAAAGQPAAIIDQSVGQEQSEEISEVEKSVNVGFVKTFEEAAKTLTSPVQKNSCR